MSIANLSSVIIGIIAIIGIFLSHAQADPWHTEKGEASYYGKKFAGRPTANGETFSPDEMTAAHRKLPLGTKVMVKNPQTGEQVEVKINDRGPYADPKRRIIDLSRAAADSIGIIERGVAKVDITVTEPPTKPQQGDEDFEVQVGAFQDRQSAEEVLEQIQNQHYPSYIEPREDASGTYYRVRVGPFATEAKAEQVAKALKQDGHAIFLDEVPDAVPDTKKP